jgi:hypothetical protein
MPNRNLLSTVNGSEQRYQGFPPSPLEQERLFVRLFEILPYEEPFSLAQLIVSKLCQTGPLGTLGNPLRGWHRHPETAEICRYRPS